MLQTRFSFSFWQPQLVLSNLFERFEESCGKMFLVGYGVTDGGGLHQPEKRNITFLRRNESKGNFGYFSLLVSSFLNFKVLGLRKKKRRKKKCKLFWETFLVRDRN
jgi:hypothetical protein